MFIFKLLLWISIFVSQFLQPVFVFFFTFFQSHANYITGFQEFHNACAWLLCISKIFFSSVSAAVRGDQRHASDTIRSVGLDFDVSVCVFEFWFLFSIFANNSAHSTARYDALEQIAIRFWSTEPKIMVQNETGNRILLFLLWSLVRRDKKELSRRGRHYAKIGENVSKLLKCSLAQKNVPKKQNAIWKQ